MGFPGGTVAKNLPTNAGDSGSIPESGYSGSIPEMPWNRKCNPLQYSYLENPMGRGAWRATVHGIAESGMIEQLSTPAHTV